MAQEYNAGWFSRYSDWLRAGRSGESNPGAGARFSAPVHTGPGAHTASCTMGTGSFPGVKSGRGVTLTPHPLLVPWTRKSRVIPLLTLWAVRPVQRFSACKRVHFTFTLHGNTHLAWKYSIFQSVLKSETHRTHISPSGLFLERHAEVISLLQNLSSRRKSSVDCEMINSNITQHAAPCTATRVPPTHDNDRPFIQDSRATVTRNQVS